MISVNSWAGWQAVKKALTLQNFLEDYKYCESLIPHDATAHRAWPLCTSFSKRDHIPKSQQHQTVVESFNLSHWELFILPISDFGLFITWIRGLVPVWYYLRICSSGGGKEEGRGRVVIDFFPAALCPLHCYTRLISRALKRPQPVNFSNLWGNYHHFLS